MNQQNNEEAQTSEPAIEDLTVADDKGTDVKGGAYGDGSVRPVSRSISI